MTIYKFASMLGPADDWPVGSYEWAERISSHLQHDTENVTRSTVHYLAGRIKKIFAANPRPWEIWPVDGLFLTPDDYCRAITGHTWSALLAVVSEMAGDDGLKRTMEVELATSQAENMPQGKHHVAVGNLKKGSNNAPYLLRRLARDHPEILEAYHRGEFKSVRKAAIAAGIIKISHFDTAIRACRKLTEEEWQELVTRMQLVFVKNRTNA